MIDLERRILTRLQAKSNLKSLNRSNGNGTMYAGRPRGSGNKITPSEFGSQIYQYCGKPYWHLLLESYFNVIEKKDYKLVKKYRPLIQRVFGFDPDPILCQYLTGYKTKKSENS